MEDSNGILALLGIPSGKNAFIDSMRISEATHGFFLSNAIAEANKDNIQTLVDVSYGLGNFERSRNRILYINRKK